MSSNVYLNTLSGDTFEVTPDKFNEVAKTYFSPMFEDDVHFVQCDNDNYIMVHTPLETQTYISIVQDPYQRKLKQINCRVLDLKGDKILYSVYTIYQIKNNDTENFKRIDDPRLSDESYTSFRSLLDHIQEGLVVRTTDRAYQYEKELLQHRLEVEWNRHQVHNELNEVISHINHTHLLPKTENLLKLFNVNSSVSKGLNTVIEMLPVYRHLGSKDDVEMNDFVGKELNNFFVKFYNDRLYKKDF
jgi:hypothetical protein